MYTLYAVNTPNKKDSELDSGNLKQNGAKKDLDPSSCHETPFCFLGWQLKDCLTAMEPVVKMIVFTPDLISQWGGCFLVGESQQDCQCVADGPVRHVGWLS